MTLTKTQYGYFFAYAHSAGKHGLPVLLIRWLSSFFKMFSTFSLSRSKYTIDFAPEKL